MTVQTLASPPALPPASPPVGGPGHTADHITITALLSWLEQAVTALQSAPGSFALNGGNVATVPGTATSWAQVTVSAVSRDGSPDILDFFYGAQKIFSLNSYGEPRITAAATGHVAEIIYALSGQSVDVWQVLSSQLAVLARVGPAGDASFAGPVSRQVGGAPAAWQHPALLAGWAAYQGRTLSAKLTNDNMVQISGQVVPGTVADGTVVCVLPSGFAPLYRPEAIVLGLGHGYLEAELSGNLAVWSFGSAAGLPGGHVKISGRFPLDAR
jgi:hypothetical protein